jgi:PleD family two-component response regulator
MNPEEVTARRADTEMGDINMITTTSTYRTPPFERSRSRYRSLPVQKVVVVNGNTEVLGMLETVLDSGRYDMVFVESGTRAYSQIKKVLPNLVILCTRIEELEGLQLLTMLKLDEETRAIPVLTYTLESDSPELDAELPQFADDDASALTVRPVLRMN